MVELPLLIWIVGAIPMPPMVAEKALQLVVVAGYTSKAHPLS